LVHIHGRVFQGKDAHDYSMVFQIQDEVLAQQLQVLVEMERIHAVEGRAGQGIPKNIERAWN